MEQKILYTGLFVLNNLPSALEVDIKNKHITFEFRPESDTFSSIIGKKFEVTCIGYGISEDNEGYQVELAAELLPLFKKDGIPHITLSLSKTGSSKDTKDLTFIPMTPSTITCIAGYCTTNKEYKFD
jgi:hypothetical protein